MGEPTRPFLIPEALSFRPKFLCDPPPYVLEHLDKVTLRELAINEIEMHKVILEAQIKAADRTIAIMSKSR